MGVGGRVVGGGGSWGWGGIMSGKSLLGGEGSSGVGVIQRVCRLSAVTGWL